MERQGMHGWLLLLLAATACGPTRPSPPPIDSSDGTADASPAWSTSTWTWPWGPLLDWTSPALVDALAGCDGLGGSEQTWLRQRLARPGILPEALMPGVRDSLREATAKATKSQPLPSDEELRQLARDGIWSDLAASGALEPRVLAPAVATLAAPKTKDVPVGGIALARPPFVFDGFKASRVDGSEPLQLDFEAEARGWRLVARIVAQAANRPGGTNTQPLADGTLAVEVLRLLAEWRYLLGVTDAGGLGDGGLTMAIGTDALGSPPGIGPIAVETAFQKPRTPTGPLPLTLPPGPLLNMLAGGSERWSFASHAPRLSEQASLWQASAALLSILRPRALATANGGIAGIVPAGASQLGLALLPGMLSLLAGPLVDAEQGLIRQAAEPSSPAAELPEVVDLVAALAAWLHEVSDVSDLSLPPEVNAELASRRADLNDVLVLATSEVLRRLNEPADAVFTPLGLEARAKAFAVVAPLAKDSLHSPFLQERMRTMFAEFVNQSVAPSWPPTKTGPWSMPGLLWLSAAATQLRDQGGTVAALADDLAAHLSALSQSAPNVAVRGDH